MNTIYIHEHLQRSPSIVNSQSKYFGSNKAEENEIRDSVWYFNGDANIFLFSQPKSGPSSTARVPEPASALLEFPKQQPESPRQLLQSAEKCDQIDAGMLVQFDYH